MTVGIVCEYNPLHLGHASQIQKIRETFGAETAIVCAMSGHFVQRGAPAIFDKESRSKAAVLAGADLVVELPLTCALSSAEGFAAGAVAVLAPLCDALCFGTESGDAQAFLDTAQVLLSPTFPPLLRKFLDSGMSFPAARALAVEEMGVGGQLLSQPNNILGVEYAKAVLSRGAKLELFPIHRPGSYHAQEIDPVAPSATALRRLILAQRPWQAYVSAEVVPVFETATVHTLAAGERAMLYRLRTMTDAEFEALPYGSEGLWRKFMHACRRETRLEDILTATKSKRYTRSRLDRMAMCAFLGITEEMMAQTPPYTRVLAFSDRGRAILSRVKKQGTYLNAGETFDHPYWCLDARARDLYALFATNAPDPPGMEEKSRVFYVK